jgi:hypothetical protein
MRALTDVSILASLVLVAACSGDSKNNPSGQGGAGATVIFQGGAGGSSGQGGASAATSTSGSTNGGSGTSGGSGPVHAPDGGCVAPPDQSGCVGELYVGETIPLDIYVMFDQSGSMLNPEQGGVTRLDAVRTAVGQFLNDPASAGMGVGIGYFGYKPIGQTTCDPADYDNAAVPVAGLPGNAQPIIDSLAGIAPTGETPSGAAIRGACTYAQQWKKDHPGHETVILLVTDGKPEAPVTCQNGSGPCCPTLADAVTAATDCKNGSPGLKTYVLGVGPLLDNLGQIATAGGTDKAYLVSGGDVSKQVLDALNAIRAAAQVPCQLEIPPPPTGQTIDYAKINVVRTSVSCETTTIVYRDTQTTCDGTSGGWYFDNSGAPQKVILCQKTCDDVSVPGEQLMFSVGCDRTIH